MAEFLVNEDWTETPNKLRRKSMMVKLTRIMDEFENVEGFFIYVEGDLKSIKGIKGSSCSIVGLICPESLLHQVSSQLAGGFEAQRKTEGEG